MLEYKLFAGFVNDNQMAEATLSSECAPPNAQDNIVNPLPLVQLRPQPLRANDNLVFSVKYWYVWCEPPPQGLTNNYVIM